MKNRKIILSVVAFLLLAGILFSSFSTLFFALKASAENLYTSAVGGCVIEAESGRVLFEKNKDKKVPMASTTKIMTAITAIENCENLDE